LWRISGALADILPPFVHPESAERSDHVPAFLVREQRGSSKGGG